MKSAFLNASRQKPLQEERAGRMKEPIYFAAVYLRLSKDDGDIDGSIKSESNSISAQRELAFSYLREHEEMELFDIYADDGYSGVNFVEVR